VIGDRQRVHPQFQRSLAQIVEFARPVEQGIMAMHMQMNKLFRHGRSFLPSMSISAVLLCLILSDFPATGNRKVTAGSRQPDFTAKNAEIAKVGKEGFFLSFQGSCSCFPRSHDSRKADFRRLNYQKSWIM
jgi:hypothetical protein